MSEHPLNKAIKMREKAKKSKAHPKFIDTLDAVVKFEAQTTLKKLSDWPELMGAIQNGTKLEMPLSLSQRINRGDFK